MKLFGARRTSFGNGGNGLTRIHQVQGHVGGRLCSIWRRASSSKSALSAHTRCAMKPDTVFGVCLFVQHTATSAGHFAACSQSVDSLVIMSQWKSIHMITGYSVETAQKDNAEVRIRVKMTVEMERTQAL